MSKHLFGAVVTAHGIAANNRGETEGNLTTLQKILWNGDVYTTVSAEAIRWAIRLNWQQQGSPVNRNWDEATRVHAWKDPEFLQSGEPYVDDDLLGYMSAQAAKQETNAEEEGATTARRGRARGRTLVRRSRFEATRAISLSPWTGDVVFSVAGTGATPFASSKGNFPVPYSAEVHATRYQYGFAFTPGDLFDPARAALLVDALVNLTEVAGNHARYLYDFAPDAIIFRWTDDFAPRILYPFQLADGGGLTVPSLSRRVVAGDVDAAELVIGGSIADSEDAAALKALGATVYPGAKKAAQEVKRRMGGAPEA